MDVHGFASWAATAAELCGIGAMLIGAVVAATFAALSLRSGAASEAYRSLRQNLGRAILLGLEFLVAADIIRTVSEMPTLQSVSILGLIVVIRTFLSFTLEAELEGQWPWRKHAAAQDKD